jgi:hypothetical protein
MTTPVRSRSPAASRVGHAPTWRTPREAVRVVVYRQHLVRTTTIALVVGTVLFLINHLSEVLRGGATTTTWIETGVTYLVPFYVANAGVLVGRRRR